MDHLKRTLIILFLLSLGFVLLAAGAFLRRPDLLCLSCVPFILSLGPITGGKRRR